MIVVVCRVFVFFLDAPSKKLLVETAGGCLIGRAEVGDAKRSGDSFDPEPDVAFGLPCEKTAPVGSCRTATRPASNTSNGAASTFAPSFAARPAAASAFSTAT